MRHAWIVLVASVRIAAAGHDSRTCETADRSIVMTSDEGTITITYRDANKVKQVVTERVAILPSYAAFASTDPAEILALPVRERTVTKKHRVMHVEHADGTSCDGREATDDVFATTYLLTGTGGAPLPANLDHHPRRTEAGYLVVDMRCHHDAMTSPGGCHASEGDVVTWRPMR